MRSSSAACLLAVAILLTHLTPFGARAQQPTADPDAGAATVSKEDDQDPMGTSGDPIDADPHGTHTRTAPDADYDEIVITASPHPRRRFDVIQGTTVLDHEALEAALRPSLGDTLAELPGVTSTYFGPGSGRPVIRGLDGPRIRVLENGLGTLDASVTSPDHAVATDPLGARRIEVIRGAGTLVYGSAAVGGVVNVDDGRIPTALPDEIMEGDIHGVYGSAAEEKAGAAGVTAGVGPMALRAAGFARDTNDLDIPGFPISSRLARQEGLSDSERGPKGRVPNSDIDSKGGNLGGTWVDDKGFLGMAYGTLDTDYGVPSDPDEEIRIDLEQQRVDLHGEWRHGLGPFEKASVRAAYADYEHEEIEDGTVATTVENDAWEGRLDLVQREWRGLHGSAGVQFLSRDFSVVGAERFVPDSDTFQFGIFAVEELHLGPVTLEGGLRFEHQNIEARSLDFDRDFNGVSFSAGAAWSPDDDWLTGVSVSRTERLPSPEELLSDGPHLATRSFDIGDPTLDEEIGTTVDVTLRKRSGRVRGNLNLFYTYFDDYIFVETTGVLVNEEGQAGQPDSDLFQRIYRQSKAEFYGGEAQISIEAYRHSLFTGYVDAAVDYVRTEERSTDKSLPRIPPLRLRGGIEARSEYADLRIEGWWVDSQKRTGLNELPTDSYALLNVTLTIHPLPDDRDVTILVQGSNLTDEEARTHVSFLKDYVPLPGRDIRIGMRVAF